MAGSSKSTGDLLGELKALVVDYAKQETVDPLRTLGRYLLWGLTGSLLIATGGIFVAVGLLRVLQTQTGGWLDGRLSFLPYVFVLLSLLIVIILLGLAVLRSKKQFLEQP